MSLLTSSNGKKKCSAELNPIKKHINVRCDNFFESLTTYEINMLLTIYLREKIHVTHWKNINGYTEISLELKLKFM